MDEPIRRRIADKIEWLAANAERTAHERLSHLPKHLRGLCKRREGDYRILYWLYQSLRTIKIYGVIHRSTEYDLLK
ncbi:MAG: hypothetical protein A2Z34_04060 [Planctomycetes bacterium RBG_16_59_8]|nr:MAG: hypothetical protein A2Z34_04060 [Planctomycetes bacterium RBG_16_59_8]